MGLDMFAFAQKQDQEKIEIAYWRKHHDLHGWMEKLWREKGMTAEQFNCEDVDLTTDDLDKLEVAVRENTLPPTTGFFFGNNPPDDESKDDDLAFIQKAREHLADGYKVFYTSWW